MTALVSWLFEKMNRDFARARGREGIAHPESLTQKAANEIGL
jgi:hypothetical protein